MARGTSAPRVSRIGLPLSSVSAIARSSRFFSIVSAILLRTAARSAADVSAHLSLIACAASRAVSTSAAVERANSASGSPLIGL